MPSYGDRFQPGEVVLLYFHDKPTLYARIEQMQPDRKKGWWQLSLLLLTIPTQSLTWILDDDQVRGADFTMQGNPIRIERIKPASAATPQETNLDKMRHNNVVSLFGDEE
jgi:hypothetical protein